MKNSRSGESDEGACRAGRGDDACRLHASAYGLPSEEVFQACWKKAAAIYDPADSMQAPGRYTVIGECIRSKGTSLIAARR